MNNKKPIFDLEERTAKFGEQIIDLSKKIDPTPIAKPLINQIIRSATSIGANYMEANGGSSKKDFINKIYICKKEAQETKHWIRMIAHCEPKFKSEAKKLWLECQELTLIFGKIIQTSKNPNLKIRN